MNLMKLKNWLDKYGFDCEVSFYTEFCYDELNEIIYCSDNVPPNSIKPFMSYARHLGLHTETNMNTIAFLHELGHHETVFLVDGIKDEIDQIMRHILDQSPTPNEFVAKIKYFIYHRMYKERIATKWAIDFIEANPQATAELTSLLNQA